MKSLFAAALALAALPLVAAPSAAQSPNPVSDAVRASVARSARVMVAAAEEMPAGKFAFKPTPESMTFGQLTLHVATSNQRLCQIISGAAAPTKITLTATSPKSDLVAALKDAFAYCTQSLASTTDANLAKEETAFGRKLTQAALMITLSNDLADHYSQQAAYLRLNGLLPPTARPRKK